MKKKLIAIGIGCWFIGFVIVQLSYIIPSDTMDQRMIRVICMIIGIVMFGCIGFALFILGLMKPMTKLDKNPEGVKE